MSNKPTSSARDARLALALRENLNRRKAQARAIAQGDQPALPKPGPKS